MMDSAKPVQMWEMKEDGEMHAMLSEGEYGPQSRAWRGLRVFGTEVVERRSVWRRLVGWLEAKRMKR